MSPNSSIMKRECCTPNVSSEQKQCLTTALFLVRHILNFFTVFRPRKPKASEWNELQTDELHRLYEEFKETEGSICFYDSLFSHTIFSIIRIGSVTKEITFSWKLFFCISSEKLFDFESLSTTLLKKIKYQRSAHLLTAVGVI